MFIKVCPFAQEVSELEEGTLSPERVLPVREHLATCTYCTDSETTRRSLSVLLRENDPATLPTGTEERLRTASLRAVLLERCQTEGKIPPRPKILGWNGKWAWLGGGMVATGLLLVGAIVLRHRESTPVVVHLVKQQKQEGKIPVLPSPAPRGSLPIAIKNHPGKSAEPRSIEVAPKRSIAQTHTVRQSRRQRKPEAIESLSSSTQIAKRNTPQRRLPLRKPIHRELPEPEHLVIIADGNPDEMQPRATPIITVVAMGKASEEEQGGTSIIHTTQEENHP